MNFGSNGSNTIVLPSDVDPETKAFVEEMNENWDERRNKKGKETDRKDSGGEGSDKLYSLESMKRDYRLKKQRIHAGLWVKEIEKQEEAKLGSLGGNSADDIDRLLDSCSEYALFLFSLC